MRVPMRWLGEFINLPTSDPAELSTVLAMLGHEVDGYETLEAGWSSVVVGRVEKIAAHPDADKIRVCQVDTGSGPEQIICGAWNFSEGAMVAVARPGTVLPGEFEIGQRTIRGVESNGMICSEKELGLGEDHTGILVLEGQPPLGTELVELLELPDVVFDLAITPNRPDAMSLLGIARDLAAHYQVEHRVPPRPLPTVPGSSGIAVEIGDPIGCRRFTARLIRDVTVGRSPLWVRHRLNKAGIRAISNVVDATNYVMLELGHPLHAFDADSIAGGRLRVKRADQGETLVTLDDVERNLSPEDLIIYDDEGPTSMSGTMGGARSEVSAETVNVLMEAASWDPPTIMYMSRRHGLRSEASTRFERGVDPNLTDEADARAAAMVVEMAGGTVAQEVIDEIPTPIRPAEIELDIGEVERVLGPGFTSDGVADILTRLGMAVEAGAPLRVEVPTYRPDLTRSADLIEEVARIHGYDRFAATVPLGAAGSLTQEQKRLRALSATLVGVGLNQAVTLPFVNVEDLRRLGRDDSSRLLQVKNPLREEEGTLRPTMIPGLLNAARFNLSHGAQDVSLFEIARVFTAVPWPEDPRLPTQVDRLAWVMVGAVGPQILGSDATLADVGVSLSLIRHVLAMLGHDDVELEADAPAGYHQGRSAAVRLSGSVIGHAGELSPRAVREFDLVGRVAIAEIELAPILAPPGLAIARSPSVFPQVDFDLSFLLPSGLEVAEVIRASVDAGVGLVESARVFDEFRGPGVEEGKRAVAIRYRLRADDRTLTNEEVSPVRAAMIAAAEGLGAQLRGV
ncbi:MAG TPA: phenylalanine--tRNA ligase subunit beta [Acidimicrobiia bacterium]|nr:phenylalanine--tRNA ligase subunit beta [Acidimicrobiia bacterium]